MKHFEVTIVGAKPDDQTIGVELGKRAAEHLAQKRANATGCTCHIWKRVRPWKRERIQEVKAPLEAAIDRWQDRATDKAGRRR